MSNTIPSCYVLLVFFHLWSIQIQFDCYRELRNCPGFCFFSRKTSPIGRNKGSINVSLSINSQNFYVCLPEWIAYNLISLWSPMLMMKRLKCINLSECLFVWYLYVYLYGIFVYLYGFCMFICMVLFCYRFNCQQALQDLSVSLLLESGVENLYAYLHRGIAYWEANW